MSNQIFNPYLPLNEYIPDGEPHVFGDRVYVYGSHDVKNGIVFCEENYNVWSAPVNDLTDWKNEGTAYRRIQDPSNKEGTMQLWAPDVTQGADGRYYIYYCLSFYAEIGVGVSDSPAGPFEFYGHVKYPSHIKNGKTVEEFMPFDPAVLRDDDGRYYIYYGAALDSKEIKKPEYTKEEFEQLSPSMQQMYKNAMKMQFGESAVVAELEPDMITVKEVPKAVVPGNTKAEGTGYEGHAFYEASSIRKINGKYYFVYSSNQSHELCYAISERPMEGFKFGGVIVSNGDIGVNGRKEPAYCLGNNHGGIEKIGDDYYIFYHRQTNGTECSRQGCAEKIEISADGSIQQVERTSQGLNGRPLAGCGAYPAAIACHLTDPTMLDYIDYNDPVMQEQIRITQSGNEIYVTGIKNDSTIGYKYFEFEEVHQIALEMRGKFTGKVIVAEDENGESIIGELALNLDSDNWGAQVVDIQVGCGEKALYFLYKGQGNAELKTFMFI